MSVNFQDQSVQVLEIVMIPREQDAILSHGMGEMDRIIGARQVRVGGYLYIMTGLP